MRDADKRAFRAPPGTGKTWGTRGIPGGSESSLLLVASVPTEVWPGVVRVLAPNPGFMTGPGTNTYVAFSGNDAVVIDPGPRDGAHLDAVVAAVGCRRVRAVLVTHHHPDHSDGLEMFTTQLGAPSAGPVPPATTDSAALSQVLSEGDGVEFGYARLVAISTPGHSSDHTCYLLERSWPETAPVVFTGDHLMGGNTSVVAPPDGDMAAYLDSLRKLERIPASIALPGHGQPVLRLQDAVRWHLHHRAERERAVLEVLLSSSDPLYIAAIVERVYTDVPSEAHAVAAYSVWAHLEKLAREGRVHRVEGEGVASRWQALRSHRS